MANTLNVQILIDNPVRSVIKATIIGDGVVGDETFTIYDASTYVSATTNPKLYKIMVFNTGDVGGILKWDATTDVIVFTLPDPDHTMNFDFTDFGGIVNNAGSGKTGDVLLTTTGLDTVGDSITLILDIKK